MISFMHGNVFLEIKGSYYYMFADGIASIEGAQELSDKIDAGEELNG